MHVMASAMEFLDHGHRLEHFRTFDVYTITLMALTYKMSVPLAFTSKPFTNECRYGQHAITSIKITHNLY